jgi:hypothetical protein
VSSIQNSYDEIFSANSNKAELGNKRKVEFSQDHASRTKNKMKTEKKPAMTINDRSLASSRQQESLYISIPLKDKKI